MIRVVIIASLIALALGILFLPNWYLARRIASLFGLGRAWPLLALFLAMAAAFPLATILSRRIDGPAVSALYVVSAVWLGAVFVGLSVFALLHLAQALAGLAHRPLPVKLVGWLSLGATIVLCVYALINAAVVRTTTVTVELLNTKLETGVRIVQLSDVHLGAVYGRKYLARLVDRTNALKPDLVAITGDLFDGSGLPNYEMVQPLERLKAPAFFVTGNHENYEGADKCAALVAQAGVRVLRNEVAECAGLLLVGIDSPQREQRRNPKLSELAQKFDRTKPIVLLYHVPLGLAESAASGVDLQLSGHTHNGQLFPFTLTMPLAYRFFKGLGRVALETYRKANPSTTVVDAAGAGLNKNGAFYIFISQGSGTWGLPMRLGSRSEIVLLNIVPKWSPHGQSP